MTIKSQVLKYYSDRTEKSVDIFSTLILQMKTNPVPCCSSVHCYQFLLPKMWQICLKK